MMNDGTDAVPRGRAAAADNEAAAKQQHKGKPRASQAVFSAVVLTISSRE